MSNGVIDWPIGGLQKVEGKKYMYIELGGEWAQVWDKIEVANEPTL